GSLAPCASYSMGTPFVSPVIVRSRSQAMLDLALDTNGVGRKRGIIPRCRAIGLCVKTVADRAPPEEGGYFRANRLVCHVVYHKMHVQVYCGNAFARDCRWDN